MTWRVTGGTITDQGVYTSDTLPGVFTLTAEAPSGVTATTQLAVGFSATGSVRFSRPDWFNATLTGRFVGDQYEDDLNTLPLGSYFVVDFFLSRNFGKWLEAYLAIDNLFDQVYTTGRTSEGVISIGEPRMIRGGVRLHF